MRGTVNFEQRGDKVRVAANVSGLQPNGEFGFHIHEAGDCSSGDGMSAKGHFNPLRQAARRTTAAPSATPATCRASSPTPTATPA